MLWETPDFLIKFTAEKKIFETGKEIRGHVELRPKRKFNHDGFRCILSYQMTASRHKPRALDYERPIHEGELTLLRPGTLDVKDRLILPYSFPLEPFWASSGYTESPLTHTTFEYNLLLYMGKVRIGTRLCKVKQVYRGELMPLFSLGSAMVHTICCVGDRGEVRVEINSRKNAYKPREKMVANITVDGSECLADIKSINFKFVKMIAQKFSVNDPKGIFDDVEVLHEEKAHGIPAGEIIRNRIFEFSIPKNSESNQACPTMRCQYFIIVEIKIKYIKPIKHMAEVGIYPKIAHSQIRR